MQVFFSLTIDKTIAGLLPSNKNLISFLHNYVRFPLLNQSKVLLLLILFLLLLLLFAWL